MEYLRIADRIAAEIAGGRLRPGDRLAPQRVFARAEGVAESTAARVYAELRRRGLVVGEVGRGTFVRAAPPRADPAVAEPAAEPVDLRFGHPVVPGQARLLARGLDRLLRPDALADALRPATTAGNATLRRALAALWTRPGGPDASGTGAGNAASRAGARPGRSGMGSAASQPGAPPGLPGTGNATPQTGEQPGRSGINTTSAAFRSGVRPDCSDIDAGGAASQAGAEPGRSGASAGGAAFQPGVRRGRSGISAGSAASRTGVQPGRSDIDAGGAAFQAGAPTGLSGADGRTGAFGDGAWPGWGADVEGVVVAGGGRQALAAVVAALVRPGERLAVEDVSYPMVRVLAERLGVRLVPVAMDGAGMRADALLDAHRRAPVAAVYVQPTLHNPYGVTMPAWRRAELADTGLTLIEDAVWAFLEPDAPPPLAAFAPDRAVLVDGLAKRCAPGLGVGYALTPPHLTTRVADAVRDGAWGASGFAVEAATGWLNDGTVAALTDAKRADARERQRLVGNLPGTVRTAPHSYFCWWELPAPWRAETFTEAARRAGIAVAPGEAFAVARGSAPAAVRLALSAPPPDVLRDALDRLAALAAGAL
nr:PLP-dependent aminotransferase family protein [Actinomadura flavalba]